MRSFVLVACWLTGVALAAAFVAGRLRSIRNGRRGMLRAVVSLAVVAAAAWWLRWLVLPCGFRSCDVESALAAVRHRTIVVDRYDRTFGVLEPGAAEWVPLERFPTFVVAAVLNAEDRRFWNHPGVDYRGVVRAAVANLRGRHQGASTIAMQLAQFVVGTSGTRRMPPDGTIAGKLAEASIGIRLVNRLGHAAVVEAYLNLVPLGGATGLEAAARSLFGSGASGLSPAQGAMLAAMIRAPTRLSPRADSAAARAARNGLLHTIATRDTALSALATAGMNEPLRVSTPERGPGSDILTVFRRPGMVPTPLPDTLRTTIDLDLETEARAQIRRTLRGLRAAGRQEPANPLEAIYVGMSGNGAVRAWVAGDPDEMPLRYDRIAEGRISEASTLKPFLLAAALEERVVRATEPMADLERRVRPDLRDPWTRRIRARSRAGETVLDALTRSDNWLAVLLWDALPARSLHALDTLRFPSASPAAPVEALGTRTIAPLDLVAAYATFANGGYRVQPRLIQSDDVEPGPAVWSPRTAHTVSRALRNVAASGTARAAGAFAGPGDVIGAKTGTTDGNREFLIVGFHQTRNDTTVALLWVGHDMPRTITPRGSSGTHLARPWADATVQRGSPRSNPNESDPTPAREER